MTDPDHISRIRTAKVRTEADGTYSVIVTVTVAAARSVVFSAFTDPGVLARWFWPQRFGTRVALDLQPGGAFGIHADGPPEGQAMGVTGVYQDVEAPARLTMS